MLLFPVSTEGELARDSNPIVQDLARRRAAQSESDNVWRQLFEHAECAIFLESDDGRILDVNARACDLLGYTREELLRMRAADLMPPEAHGEPGQAGEAEPAVGEAFETVRLRKDGAPVLLEVRMRRITGMQGAPPVVCIARDITERKEAEARMQAALTKEHELNELKSRFIATASHEFRTPLSTILSATQLLEQYDTVLGHQERAGYLHRVQAAVHQMTALLEVVSTISKVPAGRLQCHPEPLNLAEFCVQLIEEVEGAEAERRRMDLKIEGGVRTVHMDPRLLRHILQNLLSNALKYSPVNTQIGFFVTLQDSLVIFKVVDRGPGIPGDELPHLFEPFFRGRSGCQLPGSGLGMTIVQESVQLHGGSVTVQSTVGAGTTVIVNIPVR